MSVDIKANGQRAPIKIDAAGEMVIDGRNRCIACEKAGVPVEFIKLSDAEDLVSIITSENMHRRHLTISQRAMIAAGLANLRRGGLAGTPAAAQNKPDGAPEPEDGDGETDGPGENVARGKDLPVDGVPAGRTGAKGKRAHDPGVRDTIPIWIGSFARRRIGGVLDDQEGQGPSQVPYSRPGAAGRKAVRERPLTSRWVPARATNEAHRR